jgi:hypothetical protein
MDRDRDVPDYYATGMLGMLWAIRVLFSCVGFRLASIHFCCQGKLLAKCAQFDDADYFTLLDYEHQRPKKAF